MKSIVKNCLLAVLKCEARLALARRRPRIVAITGSVGKTSTKDAVAVALAPFFSVRKNEKSYNSDFGVPMTILGLKNAVRNPVWWCKNLILGAVQAIFPEKGLDWLVLEVGAGEPGDIKKFAEMLSPDIVVVTRFPAVPVHVEYFASPGAVISEKIELVRAVRDGGVLVLNADDEKVYSLKNAFPNRKAVLFGTNAGAGVRGTDYEVRYEAGLPVGISFRVLVEGQSFAMNIHGVLGRHLMQPILAAFAVAYSLGLDVRRVAEAFKDFAAPAGRMRLIDGANDLLIIDDSYNASPVAVREALSALGSLAVRGRKIAVLGVMAELGAFSAEEHRKIGVWAAKNCSKLVVVGEFAGQKSSGLESAQEIAAGAKEAGMAASQSRSYTDSTEAAEALPRIIQSGDVVLVKGSQSARMERVVKALMREPKRAKELLVRQDNEWM